MLPAMVQFLIGMQQAGFLRFRVAVQVPGHLRHKSLMRSKKSHSTISLGVKHYLILILIFNCKYLSITRHLWGQQVPLPSTTAPVQFR